MTIRAAKGVGSVSKKAAKGVVSVSKATAKGVTKVSKRSLAEMQGLGGMAFKKVVGLIDDDSEEESVLDGVPQTEEQEFVTQLYDKVHTQSDMVQQ